MMRDMTGLLTFTEADNYGALLQAYALQSVLKSLGHDSVFLTFKTAPTPPNRELVGLPPQLRKRIEETVRHHRIRSEKFEEFRNQYLSVSEFIPPEEAEKQNERFDRFIVGSDQVWNSGITGGSLVYTLPFAESAKRFSYAASFGGEGTEKATDAFWNELSRFQKISLREGDGAQMCMEKTGITPSVHIDPCLLLSADEWQELLPPKNEDAERYVLLFLIEYDASFYNEAVEYAKANHLPLCVVTASYMPQFGFEAYSGTGVTEWLECIRHADCVFCDSFHATVFSVLFERKFKVNLSKAKLAGRSSRLTHLLEMLALRTDGMNDCADYSRVKEIIKAEKEEALSYLSSIYE